MNGHMKSHGKHMLLGGAGIVVLMMALGVGWQQAVTWGVLLACPLGMMAMMWFMGRQNAGGAGHEHGAGGPSDTVPQQRVSEGSPERRPAG
jgi:hypothetical protein